MNSNFMRKLVVVISVVSLLGASCSSNDDGDAPAGESPTATLGPELEPDDSPLSTLTVAADVGEFGKPIDASAAFADTAPQVTAIADVQAAGTVTLKWLQVPDEGDPQELFSHEVAVEPEQVAFSKGTSPGVLEPGTYRVEATLNDDAQVVEFVVEAPDPAAPAPATGAPAAATGPPQSGPSGAMAGAPAPSAPSPSLIILADSDVDYWASDIGWTVTAAAAQPTTAEVTASIGDRKLTKRLTLPATTYTDIHVQLDPCRLGNDLPGTQIDATVRFVGQGAPAGGNTVSTTLGPDQTKPVVSTFDTGPQPGSKVKAGDTIGVDILARDQKREGSTWQTGVQSIQLLADGLLVDSKEGPRLPPQCDEAKRILDFQAKYVVPDNPPAVIKLCALAEDYAGNVGTKCHEYYTGEVWEGTIDGTGVNNPESPACPNPAVTYSGDFTMTIAPDGNATLTGTQKNPSTCGGGGYSASFTLQGKKTDSRVSFPPAREFIWTLDLDISGSTALGVIDEVQGMYHYTITYRATCQEDC